MAVIIFVNLLTAIRIVGLIPFLLLINSGHNAAAFGLFILLALTDAFDGYLARKLGCVTDFGKFFDPVADKICFLTVIFVLLPHRVAAWGILLVGAFLFLVLLELMLFFAAVGRYMLGPIGFALGANRAGKIKVWIEIGLILVLFINRNWPHIPAEFIFLMIIASLCAAKGSFIGHIVVGYRRDVGCQRRFAPSVSSSRKNS